MKALPAVWRQPRLDPGEVLGSACTEAEPLDEEPPEFITVHTQDPRHVAVDEVNVLR
jgi:hypothetical protein